MLNEKLLVAPSPHLRSGASTQDIMRDVLIALLPAVAASVILFGLRALVLECICVAACMLAEYITRRILHRDNTIMDLSAAVTGLILALNLPVTINPLFAVIGCIVAIVIVKQLFGGLGQNFVNPAATARVVLLVSFPAAMSRWVAPFYYKTSSAVDAVTTATPLTQLAKGEEVSNLRLFLGDHGGCIGETCVLALLIGFVYLLVRRVISPVIPLTFIGTVALFTLLLGGDPLAAMMTGGVMIGAIFMATDYTTSPVTPAGRWIFGIGCGLITVIIRQFGALSEGVSYAIVLMNILVPHIEDLTRPKAFGTVKKGGKAA
jgi:electron transport complex protein RnfD